MQQYLQQLIPAPNVGYLFPHRAAIGAFGVPNEYQLNKHRPKLLENQHWFKIRGDDHIDRVFYSLAGLLLLADLIGTPQAQAFKRSLIQYCQGGAIVRSQPAVLYSPLSPTEVYAEPAPTEAFELNSWPAQTLTPTDPAYSVAPYLQPDILQAVNQAISSHSAAPDGVVSSSGSLSPAETAALIFEAQRVVGEQIFQAQRLSAEKSQPPSEIHVTVNLLDRWNSWLDQQDAFAFSLFAIGMVFFIGLGSWLLVDSAVRQPPAPTPSYNTQSTWR